MRQSSLTFLVLLGLFITNLCAHAEDNGAHYYSRGRHPRTGPRPLAALDVALRHRTEDYREDAAEERTAGEAQYAEYQ